MFGFRLCTCCKRYSCLIITSWKHQCSNLKTIQSEFCSLWYLGWSSWIGLPSWDWNLSNPLNSNWNEKKVWAKCDSSHHTILAFYLWQNISFLKLLINLKQIPCYELKPLKKQNCKNIKTPITPPGTRFKTVCYFIYEALASVDTVTHTLQNYSHVYHVKKSKLLIAIMAMCYACMSPLLCRLVSPLQWTSSCNCHVGA